KETAGSVFMYASMGGLLRQPDPTAYKLFRDRLLHDAGDPTDPVEVMLLEQIALAHLNIGRLHYRSATAEDLEGAKASGALAIALTGEFRRTALALQQYRAAGQVLGAGAGREAAVEGIAAPGVGHNGAGVDGELPSTEASDDGGRAIPYAE